MTIRELVFVIAVVSVMLFFTDLSFSQSTLWDLIINVNLEKNPLQVNEHPIVIGTVVDHGGKPLSDIEVKIRFDKESVTVFTNELGSFRHEFVKWDGNPGRYIVNVMATSNDDKIGLARVDFQVKGKIPVTAQSAYYLDLINYSKYQNTNPENSVNDPIGITLYNYYQGLQMKLKEEEERQKKLDDYQKYLEEQRQIAVEIEEAIIEEKNPGAGTYSGWQYDQFVSSLDLTVKEIIVNQLNYTINAFDEAQYAMEEVLKNGGTLDEARKVYYEKAAIPRELMESLTTPNYSVMEENYLETNSTILDNEPEVENNFNQNFPNVEQRRSLGIHNNGTTIWVGEGVTTIFLNINGTLIEIMVNGSEISPVTYSSQN